MYLPILDCFSMTGGLYFGSNVSYWWSEALNRVLLVVGASYSIGEEHSITVKFTTTHNVLYKITSHADCLKQAY